MATFLMLGKYTAEGIKGASPNRTTKIVDLIGKCGGRVDSMFALIGEYDLAFFVDFSGTEEAMRTSFELARTTGISFASHVALPVEQFDRLISGQARSATIPSRQVSLRAPTARMGRGR